ncbi:GRF zinc finger containing protein [Corchorus olitorius]|uniref:GRF zinc finger containing protein n=1 Tax=Corchorus olitorius TaxID=93759 RepID=A0A1R3IQ07_9ROSI|nr:GRF zinc finger containing protein [Corchorus olitorius]
MASMWTSWTNGNSGRRFYSCPNFVEGKPYCKDFRVWHDEAFPDRAKEVILELKDRERMLYNEARFWKNEAKMLKQSAVDFVEAELIEENALLRKECGYLRYEMQVGKRWKWGKMSVATVCFLVSEMLDIFNRNLSFAEVIFKSIAEVVCDLENVKRTSSTRDYVLDGSFIFLNFVM